MTKFILLFLALLHCGNIYSIIFFCKIPENNSLNGFCNGLVEAWKLYNNKE